MTRVSAPRRALGWHPRWALAVSALLHPLLMPTLLFALLLYYVPTAYLSVSAELHTSLLWTVFLFTGSLPGLTYYFFYRLGLIRSLLLDRRADRPFPMFFTSLLYGGLTFVFYYYFRLGPLLVLAMASIAVAVTALTLVSLFWQISAHAVGLGGTLGYWLVVIAQYPDDQALLYPLLLLLVLCGLGGSARLAMNAHTPAQVWAGLLLGAGICHALPTFLH